MTQKHSAAQETESADEGEFTSAPTPLNDRAFELLLTSVLALVR
jgi:hypothetical protein